VKRWLVACFICVAACSGDDASTPHAGTLAVTLAAGGPNDGALMLLVSGGPVTEVAASGYEIGSSADAKGTHIMVVGNVTAGTLATITVPDASRSASYVVTVEQAADRTSFALLDPAGYKVTVGPTP